MRKNKLGLGILATTFLFGQGAHADLKELIQEHKNDTAVIIQVPGHDADEDNGYGLLLMPPDDYAGKVGLLAPGKLENANFKIVEFKVTGTQPDEDDPTILISQLSDDALSTSDFDGTNVLYHLNIARNYYAKLSAASGFPDEALDHKISVRIRTDLAYNLVTHAAEKPDFNNARYIPKNYGALWGQEVWFDSPKKQLSGVNWYDFAVTAGMAIATKSWETGAVSVPMQFYEHYNAGLDAAKMPDVIYHEAFHYATDAKGLFPMASEGNPVAEDYANYFGSSIIGKPQIAEINEFSSRFYKHNYNKIVDIKDTTPSDYNAFSFGPSIFWQIRKWVGQARADQLVWNSLLSLKGSFKHRDVPVAVSAAAHADQDLTAQEIQEIDDLLAKHHQSYENLELKFNPGEALALMEEAKIQAQGVQTAQAVRAIPDELGAAGVTLSDEDKKQVSDTADAMEAEAKKPGFKDKVIGALRELGHLLDRGAIDAGKGIGYAGSAISAATEAPLSFGTDFTTGLILGHGLISEHEQRLVYQLTGAGGGVASIYYTYAGLGALGFAWATPVTTSAMGIVFVDSLVCMKANPTGKSEKDQYCAKNNKIMAVIGNDSAKAGDKSGTLIRRTAIKVGDFFAKPFRHKKDSALQ